MYFIMVVFKCRELQLRLTPESSLRPLPLSIFINDLPLPLYQAKTVMYAGDPILYLPAVLSEELSCSLDGELRSVVMWA